MVMCSEESGVPAVFQKVLSLFSIPMNCTGKENCDKSGKTHKIKPLNMSKLSSKIKVFHCLLTEPRPMLPKLSSCGCIQLHILYPQAGT